MFASRLLGRVFGLAGCGAEDAVRSDTVVPNVVGKKLDVALNDIKRAGFAGEVQVLGGGAFGVVDESNWQVCDQVPAAGQVVAEAPRLTVDRTCGAVATEPVETDPRPASTEAVIVETIPTPVSTEPVVLETIPAPAPTEPISKANLTAENNADLAGLLAGPECGDVPATFAAAYRGKIIEFDGHIAYLSPQGDTGTRFDFLVLPGDYGEAPPVGAQFQFRAVTTLDLHLTGSNIPDALAEGNNLHVIAEVGEFVSAQCLFLLTPVSTQIR